jgi:hypothetical protein
MTDDRKIFWQGTQWRVTDHGIEDIAAPQDEIYWIDVDDLYRGWDEPRGGWPAHVAGKSWIDFDEFVKAYLIACVAHGVQIGRIGEVIEAGYRHRRTLGLPMGRPHEAGSHCGT